MTRDEAVALDAADPLAGFRERFVLGDGDRIYLDGNSLGRLPVATRERLRADVDRWGERLVSGWPDWIDVPARVGDLLAAHVLGARPGEVLVGDSTTVNLYKLCAAALDLHAGPLIIERGSFPTDRYVLEGLAAQRGLELRLVDDVAAALDGAALVVHSHVDYRSGEIADIAGLTERARAAGARVVWDLCHSAGAVAVDLRAGGAELAVGCTYKYLNGGPGAPAFGYVRTGLQQQLQQPLWGWMGAHDPFGMSRHYQPADDVRRFLTGTPPILAMQPLKHMVDLIAEAGMDAVRAKSVLLTEQAISLTDELLVPLGVELSSPRDAGERGSHITIDHPRFRDVVGLLWERGVIPDFRPPHGLRIGLSPLSTSFTELQAGMEAIRDALLEVG